jgi:hypothetical protein
VLKRPAPLPEEPWNRSPYRRLFRAAGAAIFAAAFLASLTSLPACNRTPAEPESKASPAETSAPAVTPLAWDAPGTWTLVTEGQRSGPKKAVYKIPKVGNDKEEAELTVFFFGTGSEGDVSKRFSEWFGEFDGNVGATAQRESFEARGLKVEMADAAGTFKIALGPKVGPQKKAPMQMVKENYRLLGAVVKTPDRGNWFFKLVGPNETVQAARSAFRSLLESAR